MHRRGIDADDHSSVREKGCESAEVNRRFNCRSWIADCRLDFERMSAFVLLWARGNNDSQFVNLDEVPRDVSPAVDEPELFMPRSTRMENGVSFHSAPCRAQQP